MKPLFILIGAFLASNVTYATAETLFDGRTFAGWEGETATTWRIADGAIVGGSLSESVSHNEFLSTTNSYKNFDLRLKFRLVGREGFINAGVQFRSTRIPNHYEMIGYQADLGEGYYGSLYDESRRNKVLVAADKQALAKVLKLGEWNEYRIRCEGPRVQLWINGLQTVDYSESDPSVEQSGKIALQIHGGGKAEVWYKDLILETL